MRATLPFERPLVAQCPVKPLLKCISLIGTSTVHATCQWLLLIGTGAHAVHATCQWLLLLGIGGIAVHATFCSDFLTVTAKPAGTFVCKIHCHSYFVVENISILP
ncbi:uncharacterized protein F5147DRAFT_658202 [Suillus discolor]|uniref:Uncharacterized protein n=1 Tax=Suillus discolor TaxID=1912936 RepID=A0A9P7JMD6_9AGAM|nr:uncharacterized protein F5147DRAFT_658202 [Suillus discolor]KAG2090186.1 hypothetical protein F5147DRAFT_658202 [Suillus discolor]